MPWVFAIRDHANWPNSLPSTMPSSVSIDFECLIPAERSAHEEQESVKIISPKVFAKLPFPREGLQLTSKSRWLPSAA